MTVEELLVKLYELMNEDHRVADLEVYVEVDGGCHTEYRDVHDAYIELSTRRSPFKKHVVLS